MHLVKGIRNSSLFLLIWYYNIIAVEYEHSFNPITIRVNQFFFFSSLWWTTGSLWPLLVEWPKFGSSMRQDRTTLGKRRVTYVYIWNKEEEKKKITHGTHTYKEQKKIQQKWTQLEEGRKKEPIIKWGPLPLIYFNFKTTHNHNHSCILQSIFGAGVKR